MALAPEDAPVRETPQPVEAAEEEHRPPPVEETPEPQLETETPTVEERDSDWGIHDEEDESDYVTTISTATFMVEYLCDESDELGEFVLNLVFLPIETGDEDVLPDDLPSDGSDTERDR